MTYNDQLIHNLGLWRSLIPEEEGIEFLRSVKFGHTDKVKAAIASRPEIVLFKDQVACCDPVSAVWSPSCHTQKPHGGAGNTATGNCTY